VASFASGENENHRKRLLGKLTSGPRVEPVASKHVGSWLNETVAIPSTSQDGRENMKIDAEAVTQQSDAEICKTNSNLAVLRCKRSQQLKLYKIRFKSH
jgi:hypothetical protein